MSHPIKRAPLTPRWLSEIFDAPVGDASDRDRALDLFAGAQSFHRALQRVRMTYPHLTLDQAKDRVWDRIAPGQQGALREATELRMSQREWWQP